jgi:adenylosuccinate lyase
MPSLITDIKIEDLSIEWKDVQCLHAHGQPASYAFGERNWCFVERLEEQMRLLFNIPLQLNLGGAEI